MLCMAVTERRQDLLVFKLRREASTCGECGTELLKGDLLRLQGEKGALCLECADMDHLEFLPSGDAAITRRSSKYSGLKAVVVQWSSSRTSRPKRRRNHLNRSFQNIR